ncbi:FeoA family protein [Thiomicrorhabdus arctica]|uniref:FeoA family protein n=1 Tax=Thiomicrorhabdus arctica TaxID=131540 RepID=UPI00037BE6DE|nr:FeoA family protein [Thiomicrorhabdus arctica]
MPNLKHNLPLSHCHAGQISQITALQGDSEIKMRLVHLGFHTNSVVELILIRGQNLVVCVDGSRFAVDKQIANYIQVEPLS